jgi:caffeoyl-CoA O-methyltransferase
VTLPAVPVTPELEDYMVGLLPPREPVLARLEREAAEEDVPAVGPQVGALLRLLADLAGPQSLLELGTALGYSGIWLLRGARGGRLVTLESSPERAARARANFAEAGLAARAEVVESDALAYLESSQATFDLCFNDLLNSFASEEAVERCFRLVMDRLAPGGLLLADNALRRGEVVEPPGRQARNVVRWNELVAAEPRLQGLVLPLRDGVSVYRLEAGRGQPS